MRPDSPSETRTSLLARLRSDQNGAWREFEDRYREMMLRFCQRKGLQLFDAEDVVQGVLVALAKTLPEFVYDRNRGRFRDYLYRCVRNAIGQWAKQTARAPQQLRSAAVKALVEEETDGRADDGDVLLWNDEWVANHYRRALSVIRETFEPRSVEIFDLSIRGSGTAELAALFSISEEAVRKARERIRDRISELIGEQVREEEDLDSP